jgi:hypothetical protein
MSNNVIELFKDLLIKKGDSALLYAKYMNMSAYDVIDAYEEVGKPLPLIIIKNTWLRSSNHGWGNGYVKIVPDHKYYGKNYDEIPVDVHGGLTFSDEIKDDDNFGSEGYWVGFDTAHFGDTLEKWTKKAVFGETLKLFRQIYNLK